MCGSNRHAPLILADRLSSSGSLATLTAMRAPCLVYARWPIVAAHLLPLSLTLTEAIAPTAGFFGPRLPSMEQCFWSK
jgi:hypothetical protein